MADMQYLKKIVTVVILLWRLSWNLVGVITRPAPGIGDNQSGGIEVVVSKNGVEIISFSKY